MSSGKSSVTRAGMARHIASPPLSLALLAARARNACPSDRPPSLRGIPAPAAGSIPCSRSAPREPSASTRSSSSRRRARRASGPAPRGAADPGGEPAISVPWNSSAPSRAVGRSSRSARNSGAKSSTPSLSREAARQRARRLAPAPRAPSPPVLRIAARSRTPKQRRGGVEQAAEAGGFAAPGARGEARDIRRDARIAESAPRPRRRAEPRERGDAHAPGLARGAVAARQGQRREMAEAAPVAAPSSSISSPPQAPPSSP